MIDVRIEYVDGTLRSGPPTYWEHLPAQGVYEITITHSRYGALKLKGHSVYWCYPEGESWVFGGGSVLYDGGNKCEALFGPLKMESREVRYMPDLKHNQVKLGHWRGTPGVLESGKQRV
jgi:hypothetical protein